MRTFRLCAAFILFSLGGFGLANASTVFDITGNANYSGTLTIDTTLGAILSADVVVPTDPDFTNIYTAPIQGASTITVGIANGSSTPPAVAIIGLVIEDGGTLVGFTGGAIDHAFINGDCDLPVGLCRGLGTDLGQGELTIESSATPLPATLPLFAGGLGVIGLFARRKKRKARN